MPKPKTAKPAPLTETDVRSLFELSADERAAFDRLTALEERAYDLGGDIDEALEADLDAATGAFLSAQLDRVAKLDRYGAVILHADEALAGAEAAAVPAAKVAANLRASVNRAKAVRSRLLARIGAYLDANELERAEGTWARFAWRGNGGAERVELVPPDWTDGDYCGWTSDAPGPDGSTSDPEDFPSQGIEIASGDEARTVHTVDRADPLYFVPIDFLRLSVDMDAVAAWLRDIDDGIGADAEALVASLRADGLTAAAAKERADVWRLAERARRFPNWARFADRGRHVSFS